MRLFNKKQLENVKLASIDKTRPALNGLYFTGNSTISTDGHRLMKVTANYTEDKKDALADWPANGVTWDPSQDPFILPKSTVEKALKNIPSGADIPDDVKAVAIGLTVQLPGDPKKVVCQTTDFENTTNLEVNAVVGQFPKVDQVIPDFENSALDRSLQCDRDQKYIRVGLSARYLKEICAQLEKYRDRSHMITLYIKDATSPVVLTADDGEGTEAMAVLMPMAL